MADTNMTDTLIVWTDIGLTDMALSFQEPEGCDLIWFADNLTHPDHGLTSIGRNFIDTYLNEIGSCTRYYRDFTFTYWDR
jgi:hypothetical protein